MGVTLCQLPSASTARERPAVTGRRLPLRRTATLVCWSQRMWLRGFSVWPDGPVDRHEVRERSRLVPTVAARQGCDHPRAGQRVPGPVDDRAVDDAEALDAGDGPDHLVGKLVVVVLDGIDPGRVTREELVEPFRVLGAHWPADARPHRERITAALESPGRNHDTHNDASLSQA